ncbi:MAG: OmpA family protein [Proteobacteria bacterium]|nr:OmpA family protein [Pseudomonadota bacterium]
MANKYCTNHFKTLQIGCALWALAALSFTCPAKATDGGFRIGGYTSLDSDAKMIIIEGGSRDGLASGDVFRIFRTAAAGSQSLGVTIETGAAKVVAVYEYKSLAELTQNSTPASERFHSRFPEVMAGDLAVRERIEVRRVLSLSPEVTLTYSTLFYDAKASPQNFELTDIGKTQLATEAGKFSNMRAGMLMVIGHTDARGSSESNQIESYQRALVVRQYLIDQLGFDPMRIVAVGKGEDDLLSEDLTPGYAERARRIAIKLVPIPQDKMP